MAEGSGQGPEVQINKGPIITRRNFLKGVGLLTGAAVGGYAAGRKIDSYLKETEGPHEIFDVEGTKVKVSWKEFKPEGKEDKDIDLTKAVIYLPGWPWEAEGKATWELPKRLANRFGQRSFDVSVISQYSDPESMKKRAEAIMRFLEKRDIKEITGFGHSVGAITAAYLASIENRVKSKGVILANPRGLNSMGLWELAKVFVSDAFTVGPGERKHKRKTDLEEPEEIQIGFLKSLLRELQATAGDFYGAAQNRVDALTKTDPIFSKIKVPVLLLVSDKDLVSEYRKYLPSERADLTGAEDQMINQAGNSNKYENLPQESREKTDKGNFLMKYFTGLKSRINRARLTRGRERYLQEKVFTQAPSVHVLRSSEQADHNAVPGPRGETVARIASRWFDRLKRTGSGKKAA